MKKTKAYLFWLLCLLIISHELWPQQGRDLVLLVGAGDAGGRPGFKSDPARTVDSLACYFGKNGFRTQTLQDSMATRAAVIEAIASVSAQPGIRTLVICLIGQGRRQGNREFVELYPISSNQEILLPLDSIFTDVLGYSRALQVLFVTDINYSVDRQPADSKAAQQQERSPHAHSFWIQSTDKDQHAHKTVWGAPVFSYFLLQLLKQRHYQVAADLNQSGVISIKELYYFLMKKTQTLVSLDPAKRSEQMPVYQASGNVNESFLVILPNRDDFFSSTEAIIKPMKPGATHRGNLPYELLEAMETSVALYRRKKEAVPFNAFVNGIRCSRDIGDWVERTPDKLGLLFVYDPEVFWARKLHWELFNNPVLRTLISPGGPYQLIHYDARFSRTILKREILDLAYFPGSTENKVYRFLKHRLFRHSARSPQLFILHYTGVENGVILEEWLPGYKNPGRLADWLSLSGPAVSKSYGDIPITGNWSNQINLDEKN